MKRLLIFILTTILILGMFGCSCKDVAPKDSATACNPVQDSDTGNLPKERSWSKQDIISMFSRIHETDCEYIDCVLVSDYASDRIGAVLFWNDREQTSNVAFFDTDGHFHQCGIFAKMSAEPGLTYLGNGAVSFQLEKEDSTLYDCTLTISVDGSDVNFKVETTLAE